MRTSELILQQSKAKVTRARADTQTLLSSLVRFSSAAPVRQEVGRWYHLAHLQFERYFSIWNATGL